MYDAYEVWLNGKLIDELDYERGTSEAEVKKYLVSDKGYSPEIIVRLASS